MYYSILLHYLVTEQQKTVWVHHIAIQFRCFFVCILLPVQKQFSIVCRTQKFSTQYGIIKSYDWHFHSCEMALSFLFLYCCWWWRCFLGENLLKFIEKRKSRLLTQKICCCTCTATAKTSCRFFEYLHTYVHTWWPYYNCHQW